MQIAILLFERVTALDAVGPYEVLSRIPGYETTFVGLEPGVIRTDNDRLGLMVDAPMTDFPSPEVIVIPGGVGARVAMRDERVLDWVRGAHETSKWTTSVCTGSLILGAAGLLDGLDATTHWTCFADLAATGANPISERTVTRGKIVTAAGVSAGIDMALTLAARLGGDDLARAIQLGIEYDPAPPFDAGAPEKASPAVVELVRQLI